MMNLYTILDIGYSMATLKFCIIKSQQIPIKAEVGLLVLLQDLLTLLKSHNLCPSVHKEIINWIEVLKEAKNEECVDNENQSQLSVALARWFDRIRNYLLDTPTICLKQDGLLNYKRLQRGASEFFPKDIWDQLSDTAKNDLQDATKCLLCGIPTPAAMISLRSAEDVLRQYYTKKTGHESGKKSWKQILNELLPKGKHTNPFNVNESLIKHLDFVRENERNVAEHPDKRFEQQESDYVFIGVVKTIIEIYKNIR